MREIKQSATANVMVFMADSTDHITGKTGLTLAVTISKDGAAFASITPTVTERGNGWYNVALATGDTGTTGDLVVRATATGADPGERTLNVVANVEADTYGRIGAAGAGLTALGDTRIANLDVTVSSRLAASGYTAPDNTTIGTINTKLGSPAGASMSADVAAVKGDTAATLTESQSHPTLAEIEATTVLAKEATLANATYGLSALNTDLDTVLARVPTEVAQKSHFVNGTGNITPPTNIGIWDRVDAAVTSRASATDYTTTRAAKLDNLDATVSSRLAASGYTAPDNTSIGLIKAKTDNLPADPASNTQVNTRLASASYTAPDNNTIGFIQKWILNKLVEGPANTWKLYDDDSTTVLKTWTWDPNTTTRSKAA